MNSILLILALVSAGTEKLYPCEKDILDRVNAERISRKLTPLVLDQSLLLSARNHCTWMTNSGRMVHSRGPVAENIAMGQRNSEQAMLSWMRSPGHRANILNPRYRSIGIAGFMSPGGTCYWCQQFK